MGDVQRHFWAFTGPSAWSAKDLEALRMLMAVFLVALEHNSHYSG